MNFPARDLLISFEVGKSGGSTGQPHDTKRQGRGLELEQGDPLVLWWVRLFSKKNSAGHLRKFKELRQQSYRRSRWGHPSGLRVSQISPFLAMNQDGRLLNSPLLALSGALVGTFLGLIASLNMVALAEPAVSSLSGNAVSADEIPSAERFSMMKDFVEQHNQYLDLSKLNEFQWTAETGVASRPLREKRHLKSVSSRPLNGCAQPRTVQPTKHRQIKNDAELKGGVNAPGQPDAISAVAGSRSFIEEQTGSQSLGQIILDSQTN
ncbi:MAG: hypothetical protein IT342_08675 [Candidatus Melainabacteria bacterium]|nr:hypothetical protein [Candidatus Melainabacteria bacterium]